MQISKIHIKNYRALSEIAVDLNQFSIIIGENDVGKTSILYALAQFFSNAKMKDPKDWYKGKTEEPVEICLTLNAIHGDDISDVLRQDGSIVVKAVFAYDTAPKYYAIKDDGSESLLAKSVVSNHLLERFVFIPVKRDLDIQFSMSKNALLGKVIRDTMHKAIEAEGATGSIDQLKKILGDSVKPAAGKIQGYLQRQLNNDSIKFTFDDVFIDPVEGLKLTPHLSDDKVDNITLSNRGAGTQNSIIIALFRYLGESNTEANFVLGLEEPENSLHPKAQRQLFNAIQKISESRQVIVTTHSPVFIDRSNYESNILLSRGKHGRTIAKTFNKDSLREVRKDLGINVSDALLKGGLNCALLVEGKTEEEAFPIFMQMAGINEMELGITIINMGGSDEQKIRTLVGLLNSYEIPCVVVLDNDRNSEKQDLDRAREAAESDIPNLRDVTCLEKGTIENYYPHEIIVEVINRYLKPNREVTNDDIKDFLRIDEYQGLLHDLHASGLGHLKLNLGIKGTEMMQEKNMPVPDELMEVFEKVKEIAEEFNK